MDKNMDDEMDNGVKSWFIGIRVLEVYASRDILREYHSRGIGIFWGVIGVEHVAQVLKLRHLLWRDFGSRSAHHCRASCDPVIGILVLLLLQEVKWVLRTFV